MINRNDPYFPNPYKLLDVCPHNIMGDCPACLGVTIRLHLVESAMKGLIASAGDRGWDDILVNTAFELADAMIARANRDVPMAPPEHEPALYTEKNLTTAIELLDTWLADNSGYDEATWPVLKRALTNRDEGSPG